MSGILALDSKMYCEEQAKVHNDKFLGATATSAAMPVQKKLAQMQRRNSDTEYQSKSTV